MPVTKDKKKNQSKVNNLKDKLKGGVPIEALDEEDVRDLQRETEKTTKMKVTYLNSLLCTIKFLCKKDRQTRYKERADDLFTASLDIRSLLKLQATQALLLHLLLTKEQNFLFKQGRARTIARQLESDNDSPLIKISEKSTTKMVSNVKMSKLEPLVGLPVRSSRITQLLLEAIFQSNEKAAKKYESTFRNNPPIVMQDLSRQRTTNVLNLSTITALEEQK